ncbi:MULTISPECIES: hypothetical protein [unclassified Sphingobium]|uniref:hypothetical protein n=1 Tax=unclassified Sphingobium TaxID=2611147 RepID=UPI0035A5C415
MKTQPVIHLNKWTANSIRELFRTGIFNQPEHTLFKPAFTQLMIELNDLLQTMNKKSDRYSPEVFYKKTKFFRRRHRDDP